MKYMVVQQTLEEGKYYYCGGKYQPCPEEAELFDSYPGAEEIKTKEEIYWQTNPHPPDLTILNIQVVEIDDFPS